MRGVQDTETGMPRGAQCAFKDLMSHSSAIRITYRISLRSSSLQEPRYPLLKVVISLLVLADWGVCTPSILEFSLTTGVGVFGVCLGEGSVGCVTSDDETLAFLALAAPCGAVGGKKGGRVVPCGTSRWAARTTRPLSLWIHRVGWVRAAPAAEAAAHGPWVIASPRPLRHVNDFAALGAWQ